ncbi:DDB1- and CUL4-associated factor 6-like [Centruroides sculpturatus]|uniref:DDB1- and CUL4-associated factor 6-like n=1 Tax=Centruroides sculpturatus TaxID=218467 RepID=UPI000C6E7788|nr:DDB1- and CUL4-associated factor 6-like [Centruroides sculpturatus]
MSVKTYIQTGHKANIFSARYLPNTRDKHVISCSGDGAIVFTNLDRPETSLSNIFSCHFGTAYEILTVSNDPHTFLSCGEDGTVRWFDLRIKNSCNLEECKEDILINCHGAVTALAVSPFTPHHLGVASSDGYVRIFDRRLLGTRATGSYCGGGMQAMITRFSVPEFEGRGRRITSLCYSPSGEEMLVSYSSDYVYLFEIKDDGRKEIPLKTETEPLRLEKKNFKQESQGKCLNKSFLSRLRVTGDWSDTGPNSRTQHEIRESGEPPPRSTLHSSLMQRMCDVLTRMFNSSNSSSSQSNHSVEDINLPSGSEELKNSPLNNNNPNRLKVKDSANVAKESQKKEQKLKSKKEEGRQDLCCATCEEDDDDDDDMEDVPKKYSWNQSVRNLQDELSTRRRNFLEKHDLEPVINLHYNGQGVTSGLITMGLSEERERQQLNLQENQAQNIQNDSQPNEGSSSSTACVNQISVRSELASHYNQEGSRDSQNEDLFSDDSSDEMTAENDERKSSRHIPLFNDKIKCHQSSDKDDTSMMTVPEPRIKRKFSGHRNSRTMIKEATFWGENFVMSGSDCGHIFIWDRYTSQLVMVLEADNHVVNCLQPHPFDPILASSGIDHDIKIWAPSQQEPIFDEKKAKEIIGRNEIMLEETKDTITVPASFMIRMLASLNNLRSAGGISGWRRFMRDDRLYEQ